MGKKDVVLSYQRTLEDGTIEKTIIENGKSWLSREWPGGKRIDFCEPQALKPEEQQAFTLLNEMVFCRP